MGVWAYIATTAGAPMSKTLALAEGTALRSIGNNPDPGKATGLIHRSHYSKGKETPRIKEIKVGDEIVLMYDFMDTGLVYPLSRFKILDPNTNQDPLINMELGPQQYSHNGIPPLIELRNGERLQPDYIGNIDTGLNGNKRRHLALIVRLLSAGPPRNAVGKIFCRDPNQQHDTILPWGDIERNLVKEYDSDFKDKEERNDQLQSLVPYDMDISDKLEEELDKLWSKGLDGRGKQLLINAKHLLSPGPESIYDNAFSKSTLPGYCLIALVEYEMLRLLKKKADIKLKSSNNDPWNIDNDLRLNTGKGYSTRLPLAPEGVDDDCNFSQQMHAIRFIAESPSGKKLIAPISEGMTTKTWLYKWDKASHPIQRARNRIAHSYYLQKVHFDELWNLVCGNDGILKLLHG